MLFVGSVNQIDDIFGTSDCGKRIPLGFRNWIESLEIGGITKTLKFGGGYGTVDYERKLVSTPRVLMLILPSHLENSPKSTSLGLILPSHVFCDSQ